ncbi:MAG: PEP-CTERM sorting domain-containing protein [Akkermansiaceae bacterium]|nr:PEP-CTERM sorting domain-containing protein [Akkermansiaceae bacterium]NNM28042.1 PEP-CTERM sorting domain-containing protein [Akkermansiaceae bacterium]
MKAIIPFTCIESRLFAVTTALLLAGAAEAPAASVAIGPAESGQEIATIIIDGPSGVSGVTVRNFSNNSGTLTVSPAEPFSAPTTGSPDPDRPFIMVDDSLLEVSVAGIPEGRRAVQVRIGYRRAGIRARKLGIRSLRVMRYDRLRGRFFPARKAFDGPTRRFLGVRADLRLGHYGVDFDNKNAWVVLDKNSTYGLAGILVPEPAAFGMIGLGLGIMVLLRRRKPPGT